jgi:hypothetical protein
MKLLYISFLLFFIHLFVLEFFFLKLDGDVSKHNGDTDYGMHFLVAFFYTFLIFILSILLLFIEYKIERNYKKSMIFLLYINSFLNFHLAAFSQFPLFSNSERFATSSKVIISLYFIFELFITHYIVSTKIYKSEQ